MKRLAFFVSGSGTNMENLVREIKAGRVPGADPRLVISDNAGAKALERAAKLGVETLVVDRKKYSSKAEFEAEIVRQLEAKKIDLICLAGFMRILSADFVKRYRGRMINIHPALLPAFPGAHGIRDSFEANRDKSPDLRTGTGVTVHYVDEGVDTGPVILQRKVPLDPHDSLETFEAKIHAVEYELYPAAVRIVLGGTPS